jgi:hypothetical protein
MVRRRSIDLSITPRACSWHEASHDLRSHMCRIASGSQLEKGAKIVQGRSVQQQLCRQLGNEESLKAGSCSTSPPRTNPVNYRVGLFVRVPGRIGSSARQLTCRRARTTFLFRADGANFGTGNSSGISTSVILRHERDCSHAIQLRLQAVNWMVGLAHSFGDPDERAHPVVNTFFFKNWTAYGQNTRNLRKRSISDCVSEAAELTNQYPFDSVGDPDERAHPVVNRTSISS